MRTYRPLRPSMSTPSAPAPGAPAISKATLGPPPVRSRTTSTRDAASGCSSIDTTSVAPHSQATASRSAGPPTTTSFRGWCREASAVVKRPTGPAPWTTTVSEKSMGPMTSMARTTVRTAQLPAAAQALSTPSGMTSRPARGTT
ncbi:MAG: hypothetical protein ABS81_17640 [Pseudonocardia sp. SCN 72-86]|nr:MAG: hypothetical protein ABS81_17640 [Pseudonocardia sp. SCN 72-86]